MPAPIQYVTAQGKLDTTAMQADLLAMFKAVMKTSKEYPKDEPLPNLVTETYKAAHAYAMRKAFDAG